MTADERLIILRPQTTRSVAAITYQYTNGFVTPRGRGGWYATAQIPPLDNSDDAWPDFDQMGQKYPTKSAAFAALVGNDLGAAAYNALTPAQRRETVLAALHPTEGISCLNLSQRLQWPREKVYRVLRTLMQERRVANRKTELNAPGFYVLM